MSRQAGTLAVRACRQRSGTILYDRSRTGYFKRLLQKFLLFQVRGFRIPRGPRFVRLASREHRLVAKRNFWQVSCHAQERLLRPYPPASVPSARSRWELTARSSLNYARYWQHSLLLYRDQCRKARNARSSRCFRIRFGWIPLVFSFLELCVETFRGSCRTYRESIVERRKPPVASTPNKNKLLGGELDVTVLSLRVSMNLFGVCSLMKGNRHW